MLVVMSGLPGAGKSAVADDVARELGWPVLSVDPVEAAMLRAGVDHAQPTGLAAYVVVEALAAEQLRLGHNVVVDAVNGVRPAQEQWRSLAARADVPLKIIEVRCSDEAEHRSRLTRRCRGIEGFPEPSWEDVVARAAETTPWTQPLLVLDSMTPREQNLRTALEYLAG